MIRILLILIALMSLQEPLQAEKISFRNNDELILIGDWTKPEAKNMPTLILLHGLGSNQEEWRPFVKFLASKGLGVLIYDARGHGKSIKSTSGKTVSYQNFRGRGLRSDWGKMVDDLRLAVQYLMNRYKIDPRTVAVGGASIGANIALRYAALHPEVPFAVLLSPGINYQGITSNDAVTQYGKRPLLIAASPQDRYSYRSVEMLNRIASNRLRITVFNDSSLSGHGVQMFSRENSGTPSQLEEKILEWVQKIKLPNP